MHYITVINTSLLVNNTMTIKNCRVNQTALKTVQSSARANHGRWYDWLSPGWPLSRQREIPHSPMTLSMLIPVLVSVVGVEMRQCMIQNYTF